MPEKCLIIGLGNIGMGYDLLLAPDKAVWTHARAFSEHPSFELVGAVDLSAEKCALFEQHYEKPAYDDVGAALKKEAASVVVIAVPTSQHPQLITKVLGLSDPLLILSEKPLASNLHDAREIVQACESREVKLFVNYLRRSDPGVIEIQKRIQNEEIPIPIKGVAWYSKGFFHNGSHLFNLLEFWLGPFVQSSVLASGRFWGEGDPEPDLFVEFKRGQVVFMAAWEEAFSHYTLELLSPAGRLRYDRGGEHITWQRPQADPHYSDCTFLQQEPEIIANGMHRYQWHVVDQLALALSDMPASLCSGAEALNTLETMHHIIHQSHP